MKKNTSLTQKERDELDRLLHKMDSGEAKRLGLKLTLRTIKTPEIPQLWWNSNLKAFKAQLKKVQAEGQISNSKLVEYMRSRGMATQNARPENYGYTYNETGIFVNNDGLISLTDLGNKLASLFDDNEDLNTIEVVILRGLQQQGAGYTYLDFVGRNPGIFRQKLTEELVKAYGGQGRYYAGYFTRIFTQLGLVEKRTQDGKARYWLTVPKAWTGKTPEDTEESEE